MKKNAPQTVCQGAYLHKSFAARTPYVKKRTCTAAIFHKNYKNSKKIVVKICRQTLKFDKKEKVR